MKRRVFNYEEMTTSMQKLYNQNEELEELLGDMKALEMAELAGSIRELEEMIAGNEESIEQVRSLKDNVFGQGGNASYLDFFQRMKGRHEQLKDLQRRAQLLSEQCVVREVSVKGFESTIQEINASIGLTQLNYFDEKGMKGTEISQLIKLGYSEEDLVLLLQELEKEDIKALKLLASKKYEEVFCINPDTLNVNMNAFIADYVTKVALQEMEQAQKGNGKVPELKKIMNALSKSEGKYKGSAQYKHLLSISAFVSMDIDSAALAAYEEGSYIEEEFRNCKYKGDLFSLCQAILYLNGEYEGKPSENHPSLQSDKQSIMQSSMHYTLMGMQFDKLRYEMGNFQFDGHFESGYLYESNFGFELDMPTDIKKVEKVKINVSNSQDKRKVIEYLTTIKEIEKQKEKLFDEFMVAGGCILIGIWNPALGATLATATNLAQNANGEEIAKFTLEGNKKIWKNEIGQLDGRTKSGKLWKGTYGNATMGVFDALTKGSELMGKMEGLKEHEKETLEAYLKYVYGKEVGTIAIANQSQDLLYDGSYFDYKGMAMLGKIKKEGLFHIEWKNEEAKKLVDNLRDTTKLQGKTKVDEDVMEALEKLSKKDGVQTALKKILYGGYDFTQIGRAEEYDIKDYIAAIDIINEQLSFDSDSGSDYGLFEDIIKPEGKKQGGGK